MDDFTSAIHDPLDINLKRQTTALIDLIPPTSPHATAFLNVKSHGDILATLSMLLTVPALTLSVATLFRPVLLDLCARWLHDEENMEEKLVAACLLVEVHEEIYPVLYELLRKPIFENGPLGFITQSITLLSIDVSRIQRLLLAYYRILQANRELPGHLLWSHSPLSILIWTPHLDNGIRLLSILCYAMQTGMAEMERGKLETEVLGEACGADCQLDYGQELDGRKKEADGWIMPVLEVKRVQEWRNAIVKEPYDYYTVDEADSHLPIHPSELSPLIANVHGVFLLRNPSSQELSSPLISTPTTIQSLRALAMHLSLGIPTLLTSPPSSGKSLLLSHLATLLHPNTKNQIISIHLADTSLDPRSLLGSYVSSSTQPGTFEWKEGVLVRAMREGKWVVFEDVDRGSSEVLGVIKPLVESLRLGKWIGGRASMDIPGRGRVVADHDFALFGTRSLMPSRTGTFPHPVFFGAHKFYEVIIPSPTPAELRTIIDSQFARLAGNAAQSIIRLWESVRALGPAASTRDVGLRELEKYCTRVNNLLPSSYQPMDVDVDPTTIVTLSSIFPNPTLREDMYLEARDVFFGAGTLTASARAHVANIAAVIAEHLGLEADRREWTLNGRTPEFELEADVNGRTTAVRVGRTRLPARPTTKLEISATIMRPFAMHRPAQMLLSRIATAVSLGEPVLLTGETGTGKTSIVTHLAGLLRRPLISLNLSHQTESSDLLGGFKPVDARIPGSNLQQQFLELFGGTFSRRKNAKFEESVRKSVAEGKWKRVVGLWKEAVRLAKDRIQAKLKEDLAANDENQILDTKTPRKRRKVEQTTTTTLNVSESAWDTFLSDVNEFEIQHIHGKGKFAFGFVEGPLVKALRSGDWVLLDEVNLASPETLECISGLLHGPTASITLTEQGSLEPVPRHLDFRLFACMNPATDVGKKDLPPNIRSRFTEIDVAPPDADRDTLVSIITQYIGPSAVGDMPVIMHVAEFYSAVKQLAEARQIADGSNHRPHYSMRTLTRALTFAAELASIYSLRRSLWEGCLMAFTMVLDSPSAAIVTELAKKHLLAGVRNPRSMLAKEPSVPHSRSAEEFVKFGPFYLEKGPLPEDGVEDYIMTPSVETKLIDLARIILTRKFPVLIEGPTSSGKTSSVEYLARRTGHRFIRINNHEHTDIQEYLGSYVSDPMTGKLVFKDGLLVRALRNGDWIVLDELNLAPTDVLEALNRLLDDNRELVIPETQEVVKPHPHFMLFATQNPPGLYAGRKVLSRAFRNRFLEVHFEDVPQAELESILCQRCRIAPSYGKRIVTVFRELQKRRQSGRVFESKQGFATLRDLFRWAGRDAISYQELAENGYMLLAERARREDDKTAVKEVIESVMGVRIDEKAIYDLQNSTIDYNTFLGCPVPSSSQLVWTAAMQRLFVLVARALRFNEPVLLVGETGSGKTSVCQVYAEVVGKHLHALNCHQNTETADLIGGLRPVRNRGAIEAEVLHEVAIVLNGIGTPDVALNSESLLRDSEKLLGSSDISLHNRNLLEDARRKLLRLSSIFEWHDGPLVEAMRKGDVFLLDEISLADDSVLERLNSVLEPARTIVLAERGGDDLEHPAIQAVDDFKLVATMNPGGDYGKKELSPALRNRFTEIWVPPVEDRSDLELIVSSLWKHESLKTYTAGVLDFVEWLCGRVGDHSLTSLRDILAWVTFSNAAYDSAHQEKMPGNQIFHHAAHMTFLDGLGSLPQLAAYSSDALKRLRSEALAMLQKIAPLTDTEHSQPFIPIHDSSTFLQLGSFSIPKGRKAEIPQSFNLQAPTTRDNAMRVIRACQVPKPILLEGSPGVGKTSLITAIANIAGHELCRINLSDQTDLIDLFGSDLPVEGGAPGEFAWKDAEFLKALQEGHWVLLDEMNLAPQAVLEGLNAVLDHRGTVYIPELGRSFTRHPAFRIFAAQNPLNQGGGRKGLPKSFVNRFTKVYIEELSPDDLLLVCQHLFSSSEPEVLRAMISFNTLLNEEIVAKRTFARDGGPWEFNLRDVIRWGILLNSPGLPQHPVQHLRNIYLHRFRTLKDRKHAERLFDQCFSVTAAEFDRTPVPLFSSSYLQIGHFQTARRNFAPLTRPGRILKAQLSALEAAGHCVSHSWLAILTGPHDSGKTDLVRVLATCTGNSLREISVNSATDTMDILGSFEQVDDRGRLLATIEHAISLFDYYCRSTGGSKPQQKAAYDTLRTAFFSRLPSTTLYSMLETASRLLNDLEHIDVYIADQRQAIEAKLQDMVELRKSSGRFEWVDGPLVRAMKEGHWLLMDGANLCNPSVLDRLNSLCEPDGVLTLSERGYVDGRVQVIKPHPNFRLFMSVDPQYGELSRAMRNRGIEVSLLPGLFSDDGCILRDYLRLPTTEQGTSNSCLGFNAARRGLYLSYSQTHTGELMASGRTLDQNSALSILIDHAPVILFSSAVLAGVTDALLYFFARTATPACIPHFNRFLSVLKTSDLHLGRIEAFVRDFPGRELSSILSRFRDHYSSSRRVPSAFVSVQAIDLYLNCTTYSDSQIDLEPPPAHIGTQALDLYVALAIDKEEMPQDEISTIPLSKRLEQAGSHKQTLGAILLVIKSTRTVSRTILENLRLDSGASNSVAVGLASKLLGYTRRLRIAVAHVCFDYSAVHAVSRWIADALEDCPTVFLPLAADVKALRETIALSSGLGMMEIWSSLMTDRPLKPFADDLIRLDFLARNLKDDIYDLRRQTFELMTLRTLPTQPSEENMATMATLTKRLEDRLLECGRDIAEEASSLEPALLISELAILTSCGSGIKTAQQSFTRFTKEIVDIAYHDMRGSLLRLVSYQHVLWAINAGTATLPMVMQAQVQWLNAIWLMSSSSDNTPNGPSALLQPTLLHTSMTLCDWSRNSLSSLDAYEANIRKHVRLSFLHCEQDMSRIQQLVAFLQQSTLMISSCFASSFHRDVQEKLRNFSYDAHVGIGDSLHRLLLLLEQTSNVPFGQAVHRFFRPAVQRLTGRPESRRRMISDLGSCWTALGKLIIELFVPDAPIDPAAIQNCATKFWLGEHANLSAQLHLHSQLEQLTTGNLDNAIICYLKRQLIEVSHHLSASKLPVRVDVSRLHMFWSEVTQFQAHVISQSNLDNLLVLLEEGEETATMREQVIQQSIAGFCQRLDTVYTEYTDVSTPLQLALLHMRLGLRLVAQSVECGTDAISEPLTRVATALVAFPTVRSTSLLCDNPVSTAPSGVTVFRHLILNLTAIAFETSLGTDLRSNLELIDVTYGQALRLWLIDRAKESENEEASQSLYRRKNLDFETVGEAEMEQQEFMLLFPSFEDALDEESRPIADESMRPSFLVDSIGIQQLVDTHHSLLSTGPLGASSVPSALFNSVRKSAIGSFLHSHMASLPDTLDNESTPFQLSLLNQRISGVEGTSNTVGKPYNFYSDSNVLETKRAAVVVDALRKRLTELIEEWPDQMVLQHLRERCDLVLNLDVHSPVALVLSSLEQLLVQSENWEIYANRLNTLKVHQKALIGLIVNWRRLELSCWQVLLESQSKSFAEGASEWWFRLYDATVRGPLDAVDREITLGPEALTEYLATLVPLLDDFIRSSPLGQFDARMKLLGSFTRYANHLASIKSGAQKLALERVERVLHTTELYFGLFSVQVSSYFSEQRKLLEKEIRGFIKLASWKDINVQALKQSAQRTHHQLYKIIRKFRDVMRQPITERLQPQLAGDAECKYVQGEIQEVPVPLQVHDMPLPLGDPVLVRPDHLVNLDRTFRRFEGLVSGRIHSFIRSRSAHNTDSFAVDIIVTAKALAAVSVPSNLTPEKREKQNKALLVRKRKAWADLLKELKRCGLAANVKPDVLRRQIDSRWLREQPIVAMAGTTLPVGKGEHYFHRLIGCLPELRTSLSGHHSDVSTRELQRGLMFLESGFNMALESRSCLSEALIKYDKLSCIFRRLTMLQSSPKIAFSSPELWERLSCINDALLKLANALEEVIRDLDIFDALQPAAPISAKILEDAKALHGSTKDLSDRLRITASDVRLTSPAFLLDHEHALTQEVSRHLIRTSECLSQWLLIDPRSRYVVQGLQSWLQSLELSTFSNSNSRSHTASESTDIVINTLLVGVQAILEKCPDLVDDNMDDRDYYVRDDHRVVRDITRLLNIDGVLGSLDGALLHLLTSDEHTVQTNIQRVLPFLEVYTQLVKKQLASHTQWTKSLLKLDLVLCSVIQTLAKQGFCKPPEMDDSGTGEDASEAVGGVGLGEGSGAENVSKEIEEQSQVEGLQGEDAEGNDPKNDEGDDDAIEMEDDFAGDMEDIPENGSDDGNESEEEGDEDPEEQLGKLDASDPSAVDEKLWGDEKGPEGKDDEKTNEDHSEEQGGKSDVVAKESKDSSAKQKPGEKEDQPGIEDEPVPEENAENDEGEDQPDASGAPMDDHVQEANTLDLPDDLDLGTGEDVQEEMEGEDEDEVMEEENAEPFADSRDDDGVKEEDSKEDPSVDNEESMNTDDGIDGPGQTQEAVDQTEEVSDEDRTDDQAVARPDVSVGDGASAPTDPANQDGGETASAGQVGSSEGVAGNDTTGLEKANDRDGQPESTQPQEEPQSADSHAAGSTTAGIEPGQAGAQQDSDLSSNPLRSLGDALKEIQKRFDEILNGELTGVPREQAGDAGNSTQVEYLHPDDEDRNMQALGHAGEEQVAKLNDLKLVDQDTTTDQTSPMDIDALVEPEQPEIPSQNQPFHSDPTALDKHPDIEGALAQTAPPTSELVPLLAEPGSFKADVEMEDAEDHDVEIELREWQATGLPEEGAEHIWRLYESLTHDLAYALCEQLRLILEPTLATRLKGDYRTGKRLNMKKIISYIASDYTKDKIWLRRTRPSQREYQVLISLDDSRSMAESHSVHLAYETLALVSKALSRLEAGDIAIAKFGETVDILHGFDEGPFTDQAGTKVMNAFRFNQKATNVLSLVDTSLKVLERARERRSMNSASAADLWQLEIIISDGICQDHEQLRTVLRKAEEQRVMIVFIIIDSLHSAAAAASSTAAGHGSTQSSILSMDKAAFKNVDGRMELQLERYLDSFPFEYYVVLRSVEALPEVLSGTLKQFFERISEE